ncbi:S24/S26 family peptidase [Magnetospirillum sulfuroxidans]|uniref:AAA family ATPase n=1 Tax=Magnetospirillum sulfuroxidans TaxID=611300 RepID=A0ABS5IES0_9PROT|nr:S24/S26 family peptidase [Magnetospirillum sulfuroxidans]MBR9972911.1 AAA family ATPase [Magnetospirillum sulfuroxidans]
MTNGDKTPNIQASGLTTDDLLALLACGETLDLSNGTSFVIEDEKARMALAWFLGDPVGKRYLASPPEKGSVDMAGLVTWMAKGRLPAKPAVAVLADDQRVWSLVSLTIRQFGGLQPFCMPDGSDAPDIPILISRPLFLAQGPNGAGKSSLARVLTFLLTGKVSSTPDFEHFADAGQINDYTLDNGITLPLPSVVPMPTLAQYEARFGKAEFVTTAVTALFEADDGTKTTICRKVVQGNKNVFSTILEKDGAVFDGHFATALGISPLAVDLSALHMARLAHLKLGQKESLADGVRALTGFREVAGLAEKTALKMKEYLGKTYQKTLKTAADKEAAGFKQQIAVLAEVFKDAASPPMPPVPDGNGSECQAKLAELEKDLDERASKVRAAVAAAAGVEEDKVELDGLDDDLVRVIDLLSAPTLDSAGLAALVAAAENLSDEDVDNVRGAIAETVKRANDFAALQAEELKIKRRRHHARIAAGLKEDGLAIPPADCPTCLRALDDTVVDDVLGMPVAAAIAAGAAETEDIKFTPEDFIVSARTELLEGIPEAVKACTKLWGKQDRAPSPAGWAVSVAGNVDKALATFSALKHLTAQATTAFEAAAVALPPCPVSALPALDPVFEGTRIDKASQVLNGLLDLRSWALSTREARATLVNEAYGVAEAIPAESLAGKVRELRSLLKDYRPVGQAREILKALTNHYDAWIAARKAAEDAVAAAEAVGRLAALKRVVDVQVDGLFRDLNTEMDRYWRDFYQAPGYAGPEAGLVRYDGVALHIPAEVEGARGSANNIANSSQVRALLFSFVLALLQSVWKRSGGLSLVLLDDPQLLFDERNQVRLAKGIVSCTSEGFRPLIMTFDRVFTARVARAGDCRMGAALSDQMEAYRIVPRGKIQECVRLELDELTLNSYRDEWRRDETNGAKIKVFCNEARSFMEHTLVNLLAEAAEPVHDHPTLDPLRVRVQNLVKRPGAVQNAEPFRQLLDLLPDGNPAKETLAQALQWSHHFQGYEDLTLTHAKAVDDMLDRFMDLREQCLDILVNRVAPKPVPMAANANNPIVGAPAPAAMVTVIGLAAASEGDTGPGADVAVPEVGTQKAATGDEYRLEADLPPVGDQIRTISPETHHAFGVGKAAQWLPFPLQESSMVICERDSRAPKKGEFAVVADRNLGKAHIGWCRMDGDSILVAGFGGKSISAIAAANCDVFPVVGAIFEGGATEQTPCHPLDRPDLMGRFGNAAEISEGDSAEPLMFKGDLVLLDSEVPGETVFSAAEGSIFAVLLGDGRWVIKRVSGPANKPYRQLLPLGVQGTGEIVTTAPGEVGLTIARAFLVVGFLR